MGYKELKYTRNSFTTAVRFPVARTMIDFPKDISDKVIIDIGGGASDFTSYLKKSGAHAISIDFRYKNLEELAESFDNHLSSHPAQTQRSKFLQSAKSPNLLGKIGNFLKERIVDLGGGGYIVQSERAYKNFLDDMKANRDESYIAAYAEHLPFKDNIADFCYSIECLTAFTINNKGAFIQSVSEAMRILKPNGELQLYPWLGGRFRWTGPQKKNGKALLQYLRSRKINYEIDSVDADSTRLRIMKP